MKLLQRDRRRAPRAKTIRPAEPYLLRGADEARRLGHNYIGTEHVLLALIRDPNGGATRLLRGLAVSPESIEQLLSCWLNPVPLPPKIDAEALAVLGIDLETVRERLEQVFGPGALEQTRSGCLGIAPRLKLALAHALDHAAGAPLADEHVLLGMLSVPDSLAAKVLAEVGVSFDRAAAVIGEAE